MIEIIKNGSEIACLKCGYLNTVWVTPFHPELRCRKCGTQIGHIEIR